MVPTTRQPASTTCVCDLCQVHSCNPVTWVLPVYRPSWCPSWCWASPQSGSGGRYGHGPLSASSLCHAAASCWAHAHSRLNISSRSTVLRLSTGRSPGARERVTHSCSIISACGCWRRFASTASSSRPVSSSRELRIRLLVSSWYSVGFPSLILLTSWSKNTLGVSWAAFS